jgi:UDP-glucose 4-epimerase
MSQHDARPRVALQKSTGFLGARLAEFLQTSGRFERVTPIPDSAQPIDTLLLNGWGSVPSSSAGRPQAEITHSVLPLLQFFAEFASAMPKHVVFFSSAGAVYANQNAGSGASSLDERAELSPNSAYGAGKIAAEAFLRAESARLGFALTILRITNVYGPGQAMRAGFGIIPAIYQTIADGSQMSLWPSSRQPRDYLYIDDFLSAFLALLSAPLPMPGPMSSTRVFNLGSGFNASVPELIAHAESITQKTCKTNLAQASQRDSTIALPSSAAFQRAFDWHAKVGLQAGIARTFAVLAVGLG